MNIVYRKMYKIHVTDIKGDEYSMSGSDKSLILKNLTERVVNNDSEILLVVIKQYHPMLQMYVVVDVYYYGGINNESK